MLWPQVCAALEPQHAHETVQTLRFGEHCSSVSSGLLAAQSANSVLATAVAAIEAEMDACQQRIERDERWSERRRVVTPSSGSRDHTLLTDGLACVLRVVNQRVVLDYGCPCCPVPVFTLPAARPRQPRHTVSELDNVMLDEDGTIDLSDEGRKASVREVSHEVVGHVLVGAEVHHRQLEALIRQRKQLLGEL